MAGVMTEEQRQALLDMGFRGEGNDFRLLVKGDGWWLWAPGGGTSKTQWTADWHPGQSPSRPDNPRFDDPITAATWLLIQASNS